MSLEASKAIQIFISMMKARLFEEKAMILKDHGYIEGELYLSAGQEATAAAVSALSPEDAIFASHRNFSVLIAAETDIKSLFYELMGIKQGLCNARSGQASYADNNINFYGSSALAASCFSKAVGAALSFKLQGVNNVCICFAGDGASAAGEFYEALNQAVILNLPVIFFIENNCYAADMPVTSVSSTFDIAERAKAFDIPAIIADGNNAPEIYEAVTRACDFAKENKLPVIVESKTYRLAGYDTKDKQHYREREEVKAWEGYDCLDIMGEYMLSEGIGNYEDLLMLKDKTQRDINYAADLAVNLSGFSKSTKSLEATK